MKSNVRRFATLAFLLVAVVNLAGCGFINALRSKNVLNEGVRTFNRGKFDDAQKMFEEALEYDPENVNARFFYAMTCNAQFEKALNSQDVDKTGTVALGDKTIKAFQDVLTMNPAPKFQVQDRAISFIAKCYKAMADQVYDPKNEADQYKAAKQKYLDMLQKRADLPEQTPQVKAQMDYTIGDDYWRRAREITTAFEKKDPATPMAPPTIADIPADKKTEAMANVTKGQEYMQKAIKDPDYPEPYLGVKLLYMEQIKTETDQAKKDEIKGEINKWDEQFRAKLTAKQEAEAAAAPAEGAEGGGAGK